MFGSDKRFGARWGCWITAMCWIWLAAGAAGQELRVWEDDTGNFRVLAALMNRTAEEVKLKKTDGGEITVPLMKLSAKDQAYVQQRYPLAAVSESQIAIDSQESAEKEARRKGEIFGREMVEKLRDLSRQQLAILGVGSLFFVCSALVFLVRAFQQSVWWGLFVLLIPCIGFLIFLLCNLRVAWRPAFVHVLGSAMIYLVLVNSGIWEAMEKFTEEIRLIEERSKAGADEEGSITG